MSNRSVEVVYCDDIRHEIGGKRSFMGVYSSILVVPSAPTTLPKFCVSIRVTTEVSDPFQSLTVKLVRGDQELSRVELPNEAITPTYKLNDANWLTVYVDLVLSPFSITEMGKINVIAITERETIESLPLRIIVGPQPTNQ